MISYKQLLDEVFPSLEQINRNTVASYDTNDIIQKQLFVYGKQGSGKSETLRVVGEYLVEKYGAENVNIRVSQGNLELLLDDGIENKLVNFLICDDATLEKIPKQSLVDFFRIRHIVKERTGRNNGLVVTAIVAHRFHGVKAPELKTDIDLFLIKNSATNPYDHDVLKRFVGEALLNELKEYEKMRDTDPSAKGETIAYYLNEKCMVDFPLAKVNYLKSIMDKIVYPLTVTHEEYARYASGAVTHKGVDMGKIGFESFGVAAKVLIALGVFVVLFIIINLIIEVI